MLKLITLIVWSGFVVLVISLDASKRRAKLEAATDESQMDLSDKSVMPWLIVGLFLGPLVLPVYFWKTRREWGFLVGLGWFALGLLLVMLVQFLLQMPITTRP